MWMIDEYSQECSIVGMTKPKPNIGSYLTIEKTGLLKSLGVYSNDKMVGFSVIIQQNIPHYNALVSVVESVFIAKAYRKYNVGNRLIKEIENIWSNSIGILITAPFNGSLVKLLPRLGYTTTNIVFFKGLNNE